MLDHRRLVRSSLMLGGASIFTILGGLARIKIAAILLGPIGVGLIGILQTFMGTVTTLAGLGMAPVATRQTAAAKGRGDQEAVDRTARNLIRSTLIAAIVAVIVILCLRDVLAELFGLNWSSPSQLTLLAFGVMAGMLSAAQMALLSGMSQSRTVAKVQVTSALLATIVAPLCLVLMEQRGVVLYVVIGPLSLFLVGLLLGGRLTRQGWSANKWREVVEDMPRLLKPGLPLMFGGLAAMLSQFVGRLLVADALGPVSLGLVQAAWLLPGIYLSVVLQVLQLDFYPQLSAAWDRKSRLNPIIDQQTRVGLFLVGPPLILGIALSDYLIKIFFDAEFAPAAEILRLHILADLLRFAAWPMTFLLLASGRNTTYMILESIFSAVMVLLLWVLLPRLGLLAAGVSVILLTASYLVTASVVTWRLIGATWSLKTLLLFLAFAGVLLATLVLKQEVASPGATVAAVVAAGIAGLISLSVLRRAHTSTHLEQPDAAA